MVDKIITSGTIGGGVATSTSPVNWHVAFWVLVSLAINSMAQPSGKLCYRVASRYRIYLCSSPFLCLADGVSVTLGIAATSIRLGISLTKASKLVTLARSENFENEVDQSGREKSVQNRTWPRWLFFIISVLPAAIKCASFRGTPWTKTWGLFYVISFAVTELNTIVSQANTSGHASSIPEILDISPMEWESPSHYTRWAKVTSHMRTLNVFGALLVIIAVLTHFTLVAWAVIKLWVSVSSFEGFIDWSKTLTSTLYLLLLASLVLGVVLKCAGCLPRGDQLARIMRRLFIAILIWPFLPNILPKQNKCVNGTMLCKLENYNQKILIVPYLYGFWYLYYICMFWLCKRWPVVARALLIEKETRDLASEAADIDFQGEKSVSLDDLALVMLCFFINNLVVCTLWYAFLYDSMGTVNPSWTNVFS